METEARLTRKEREREARKQDILEVAARFFSERDFHEVTVDEIAEAVGLSKGTLYLYFKNKDDLFYTIVVEKTQSLLRRLQEAVRCTAPFVDCLRNVVRIHCIFFQENVAYFKIMHSEKTRMSAESQYRLNNYAKETFQTYLAIFTELVNNGQTAGVLRRDEPLSLVKALRGILNAYVFHFVFTEDETQLVDGVDQIVDLYLNGAAASVPSRK